MVTFTRKIDMSPGVQGSGDIVYADHINELQIAIEQVQSGAAPIALAGIAGALGGDRADARLFDMRDFHTETDPLNKAIEAAADAGGGDVYLVPHTRTTPILIPSNNIRLIARGAVRRWRSPVEPALVSYAGDGAALIVQPGSGQGRESVELQGFQLDGRNASSGTSGVFLDSGAASSYIEGVLLDNMAVTNFPQHQVVSDGTVFDVTLNRCSVHDLDSHGDHLFFMDSGDVVSQWRFQDSWLANYADGTWAVKSSSAPSDLTFLGGTVAPCAHNHGVDVWGSLNIYGTHFEGLNNTITDSIGIRYAGYGAFISPSSVAFFGTGVQIGDGTSRAARGYVLSGSIGNNNVAAGGADVEITAGGSRVGTILDLGWANESNRLVRNLRLSTDGVRDVLNFDVAKAIRTNAYTTSNVTTDRSFNANSTTTDELADVLGTLIADLKTYGVIA